MKGIPTCEHCGGQVTTDITINQFISTYGIRKDHLGLHGLSYHTCAKYGDTPINELPRRFKDRFKDVLHLHGVKLT